MLVYDALLEHANRKRSTIKSNISMVRKYLAYLTLKNLPFNKMTINTYLQQHYTTSQSRNRAGREIVRFADQVLGMSKDEVNFVRVIKPIDSDDKLAMSKEDDQRLLDAVSTVDNATFDRMHNVYSRALLFILVTGCRPIEACRIRKEHFI